MSFSKEELEFKLDCLQMRQDIFDMLLCAGSGHLGGSLSAVEIVCYLYKYVMNYEKGNPDNKDRDRFILSKGHGAPVLYAALSRLAGFIEHQNQCTILRKLGSPTQGHPDMHKLPGVDFSTGSLGQGFAVSSGIANALKIKKMNRRVFVLVGDGEIQEGIVWEAARDIPHRKLDNLIAILDYNRLNIAGKINEISSIDPVGDKFRAFNWHVIDQTDSGSVIDGHNFNHLQYAFDKALDNNGKPAMIIAHTTKGKGFSPYEDDAGYHGVAPKEDEHKVAMELFELQRRIYESKLAKM